MAKLICLDSVSQWEHKQVTLYPEIKVFIEKLKRMIMEKPESGLYDPVLLETGVTVPCRKRSVSIALFSYSYAIGYGFLSAHYLYNTETVMIVKMTYS